MSDTRMLTELIDQRAANASSVWAETILCIEPLKKLETTYKQLSDAISFTARLIVDAIGPRLSQDDSQTLWYAGPSDVRYIVFLLAANKVGHKPLFISPRNTVLAHQRLLDATSCKHVFTPDTMSCRDVLAITDLAVVFIAPLTEIFEVSKGVNLHPSRKYNEAMDDGFLVLHTSGSTNHPKPITTKNRAISAYANWLDLPEIYGERLQDFQFASSQRMFCAFPLFHCAGIDVVHESFVFNFTLIFPPPEQPVSWHVLDKLLHSRVADCGVLPPSVLEDFVAEAAPENIARLKMWRHIGTGGASLSGTTGSTIRAHTQLRNCLGTTETAFLPELVLHKSPEDWAYHCYHPSLGIEFRPRGDDLHEAIIVREPECERFQVVFANLTDQNEFATSDLYSKHPTKHDLWLYRGRSDNLIKLTNGEKFSPDEADSLITARSDVDWSLTVGEGRFESAVLLQPASGFDVTYFDASIRQEIATSMNEILPQHARVDINHIWVLDQHDLVVSRSVKGQIQRKKVLNMLECKIDELYNDTDSRRNHTTPTIDFDSIESVLSSLKSHVKISCPQINVEKENEDLFRYGLDSLQVTRLSRSLQKALSNASITQGQIIDAKFVYNNPTLLKIAQSLFNLTSLTEKGETVPDTDIAEFESMREEIFERMDRMGREAREQMDSMHEKSYSSFKAIIITGTTGSLGCFVLDALMRSRKFDRIYCFNRRPSEEVQLQQTRIHQSKQLDTDFDGCGVEFVQGDLSKASFGVTPGVYDRMMSTVDFIVHNAWHVNWHAPPQTFQDLLVGCERLTEFSHRSSRRPNILFLSSIGAVGAMASATDSALDGIPERAFNDIAVAEPTAYSRSKLIAEHIFHHAAQLYEVSVTICRVGQIAGPSNEHYGPWTNQNEWFPSLIKASMAIGKMPADLGSKDELDWLPVDLLARVITELCTREEMDKVAANSSKEVPEQELQHATNKDNALQPPSHTSENISIEYLHLVNPSTISWSTQGVKAARTTTNLEIVPLRDWISDFQAACDKDATLAESSAAQLLRFYEKLSASSTSASLFSTAKACRQSTVLVSMLPVQEEWMVRWIEGFLRE